MRPGTIVLVVDDDAAIRDGYAELLAAVGLYAVEASNGLEALDVIDRTMPDIIVTDLTMGAGGPANPSSPMDGLQLCERLRTDPRTAEIPVIVVTGSDDDGVLHLAMEAGCDCILLKPVPPAALIRTIRTIAELKKQPGDMPLTTNDTPVIRENTCASRRM
jgi:two-component system, cell cycle response regulator